MTYTLFPDQQELVDKARQSMLKGNKHLLIQSPAGSGKSIIIADIVKSATDKGGHVMFIVHRQELVDQIMDNFKTNEVDPDKLTVMTVGKIANRLGQLPTPDMIVTDETHHSRANTYKKIYQHFPNAHRIGFTATPWRMSGKGFADIYDDLVAGKQVQWLIDNNRLSDYKYYSINIVEGQKLKHRKNSDYTKKSIDYAFGKTIFGDVVKHYQSIALGNKTILYAHSIEASEHFSQAFNDEGITAAHCDAKTPPAERDQIMKGFKDGQIQVLCNVDLISEGFNVPDCSCVIMVRPTKSLVLYIQQSMRCMRYQPEKKAIIIDHVGNYLEHGLPRDDREWSLEDRKKKEDKDQNAISVKECPSCYAVIASNTQVCPLCKHEFEVEERDNEKEITDDELELIDDGFKTDYTKINIAVKYGNKNTNELETLEDYYLFAKSRNYKESWIKFQDPELKNMSWPRFYANLAPIKKKYHTIFN